MVLNLILEHILVQYHHQLVIMLMFIVHIQLSDDDKLRLQPPTQSNSSQYLTANDETPNLLTSDDNDYADESGTVNYGYDESSSDEKFSNKIFTNSFNIK